MAAFLIVGSGASAQQNPVNHGIGFTKGCTSPTKVGDPYTCTYTVRNVLDEAEDTLTITQLVDTVHAAAPFGNQTSSTVLDDAPVTPSGGATCTAPPGRVCTIPFGGRVGIGPFTFYTVHGTDFTGANPLTDDANLTWHDLCDDPAHTGNSNCVQNPPTVGAASQSVITQRASNTATAIHDAGHNVVTVVDRGSIVHDFVSVTTNDPSPLQATPSGTVTVSFFANNQCLGNAVATSGSIPLGANGQVDATSFPQGPLDPGFYGFQATYSGDGTYAPSTGPCEPLQVVDANIQLTPATATNAVGTNHVLTCHINVNDGTGQVNAPDGTVCTVTIISGPGTPGSQNCTVSGGLGNCTATITSAATGTSVIRASTDVTVGGLVLHRETGDTHVGDGPNAQKAWVDANIQITPATATNAVGTNHVLTITVNAIGGLIDAGPHTATASILSGPGGFVGSPTCTYTGGGATASCTVTITSAATGTTVVQATSDIPVNGQTITRTTATNPGPGGSGNASKVWVDANIQISPPTATNPIGTQHVLTITVNALGGTIDAGSHTATASIISGPGSFVGSPSCTYTGGGASASCTVTITSNVPGTTVVQATSNIPVNGQTIPRTTDSNPGPGGSGNAQKLWISPDANIQISPAQATNPIGSNHTLTGHVNVAPDGSTFSNAPAGTLITFSIVSGPGSFVGGVNTCQTIAATGSCTVQITSNTAGTTVVRAATDVTISGVTLHRETNDGHVGDSADANKLWFVPDANIQISPAQATNPTGTTHVLTGHVNVAPDGSTFSNAPAGTLITFSIVSGPGSFVGGVNTCQTVAATGSCTVTITSNTGGTTVVRAATDVTVNGVQLHRETNDGHVGDSSDANKTWIPPGGIIAPTQTSCSDVANGTFDTLGQINYSLVAGKIGQGINPGVFFYYAKITTTTANQVVTVSQSNTSTNNTPLFLALNGQALLWSSTCTSKISGTLTNGGAGATFTVPVPGDYIISIKYQTKSIAGAPAPVPADITYNFTGSLGSSMAASVLLKKQ